MIEEVYVSFDTAKLLKEKGFDEPCRRYWRNYSDFSFEHTKDFVSVKDVYLLAPTQQMVMRWLREVYNLNCEIGYDYELKWYWQIKSLTEVAEYDYPEMKVWQPSNAENVNTYEEACEAAIKYCLENLI